MNQGEMMNVQQSSYPSINNSNNNAQGYSQTTGSRKQSEQQPSVNEEYDFEIDLPTKSEPNMLVDYADNTVNHYLLYKKIEQEPQYYLNFGFNLKDYSGFLMKQTFMRAERKLIEEKIHKFRGDDGIAQTQQPAAENAQQ